MKKNKASFRRNGTKMLAEQQKKYSEIYYKCVQMKITSYIGAQYIAKYFKWQKLHFKSYIRTRQNEILTFFVINSMLRSNRTHSHFI